MLDMERIVALGPDLVVGWPYSAPAQVAKLRSRGVPVFITNPKTIEGIATDLERLGALSGTCLLYTSDAAGAAGLGRGGHQSEARRDRCRG